jgi:UDP-N-acetylglucosamine:LPS N-acetylglucosamine transferase
MRNSLVLAVCSQGGHLEQMIKILSGFTQVDNIQLCTTAQLNGIPRIKKYHSVKDCNRDKPLQTMVCLIQLLFLIIKLRPAVVISTGAAPGLIALLWGKVFGAKTVWIESIANAEKLSMSGDIALKFVDVCLTQWPHLAGDNGPKYLGSVL